MSAVFKDPASNVRPMREHDLNQVLHVEREAYPFPWTPGIFRDCLRAGYCCWVVERTGEIDAYGIMQVAAGESHILNLCVRESCQRQGLGKVLLSQLLTVAIDHRADTALLEVRPSNVVARNLYAALDFHEVGVRRNYYPSEGGREDALILARSLSQSPPHSLGQYPPGFD